MAVGHERGAIVMSVSDRKYTRLAAVLAQALNGGDWGLLARMGRRPAFGERFHHSLLLFPIPAHYRVLDHANIAIKQLRKVN